jgi:hypothetical protein
MSDGPRQPVQLGYDEGVALSCEVDGSVQFRPDRDARYMAGRWASTWPGSWPSGEWCIEATWRDGSRQVVGLRWPLAR